MKNGYFLTYFTSLVNIFHLHETWLTSGLCLALSNATCVWHWNRKSTDIGGNSTEKLLAPKRAVVMIGARREAPLPSVKRKR